MNNKVDGKVVSHCEVVAVESNVFVVQNNNNERRKSLVLPMLDEQGVMMF